MVIARRYSRIINIGAVKIGGDNPIAIQSMCNTKTADIDATLKQLRALAEAGADIGRLAVPDTRAADALSAIVKISPLPLVADIHFDYRLALMAIEAGIHGLRINPGNIGDNERLRQVALAAKAAGIPIRIGVNAGSVKPEQWDKHESRAEAMAELALEDAAVLEELGFSDIKISLKSSNLPQMVEAYRFIARRCDYPLHLGATEAGTYFRGSLKNAIGIGSLLLEGIGDTIRVSLTEDPVKEVAVAKEILLMCGKSEAGWQFISCPTCGRTEIDIISLAKKVEELLAPYQPHTKLSVAVMGCVVNGPGEAKEADLGIAGAKDGGMIFVRGEKIGFFAEEQLFERLIVEAKRLIGE